MSSKDKGMAKLLSRPSRSRRFAKVMERISPKASTILDLGCGVGALATSLAEKFPSSLIVGVDKSKYLLREFHRKGIAVTVLADISSLPFKEDIFDVAIAIQVLHEIVSLKGANTLIHILKNIYNSLGSGGEFILFDHVSPGDEPVLVRLSNLRLAKLREFQTKFKHRKVTCQDRGEGLISISMRDFYDFFTKIWALNTDLEEEEMNETHTPFTRQELKDHLLKAGFKIEQALGYNTTPVRPRKGISLQSKVKFPDRQIVVLARK
ncbi:MAG: class I SAM-dependent methyltransferase [Candidatus Bathyarchaeota archaeon]|nr:class I SAM-dependent methyltransferase [Candidatus Bathyarchaeota archaeon]